MEFAVVSDQWALAVVVRAAAAVRGKHAVALVPIVVTHVDPVRNPGGIQFIEGVAHDFPLGARAAEARPGD